MSLPVPQPAMPAVTLAAPAEASSASVGVPNCDAKMRGARSRGARRVKRDARRAFSDECFSNLVPPVVYHGSPNRGLTHILSEAEVLRDSSKNHGIYFARDIQDCASFIGDQGRVYVARLFIRRPFISHAVEAFSGSWIEKRLQGTFVSREDKAEENTHVLRTEAMAAQTRGRAFEAGERNARLAG